MCLTLHFRTSRQVPIGASHGMNWVRAIPIPSHMARPPPLRGQIMKWQSERRKLDLPMTGHLAANKDPKEADWK